MKLFPFVRSFVYIYGSFRTCLRTRFLSSQSFRNCQRSGQLCRPYPAELWERVLFRNIQVYVKLDVLDIYVAIVLQSVNIEGLTNTKLISPNLQFLAYKSRFTISRSCLEYGS